MNKSLTKKIGQSPERSKYATGIGTTIQRNTFQSRSTASNITMANDFQLSTHSMMPCLMAIKNQNQCLNQQKDTMVQQLKTLDHLSQQLLTQNQALRLHYYQRSNDLGNLIKTFTINAHQQLSDAQHLIHFYKQHNALLAKQIQHINGISNQHQKTISKVIVQLNKITNENVKSDQLLRNRQAKNKLTQKNMDKTSTIRISYNIQQLQKQVCNYHLQNNKLKIKNITTLQYIRNQKQNLTEQRPQVKNLAIQAIKSVKMLTSQLQTMNHDYLQKCNKKQMLIRNFQNSQQKFKILFAQSSSKRRKLQTLIDQRKQIQQNKIKLINQSEVVKQSKQRKQYEKSILTRQVGNKKQQIKNTKNNHQKKLRNIIDQTRQKTQKIKQQIANTQHNLTTTLVKQLNPQKQQLQNLLKTLQNQLQTLNNYAKQITNKINSSQNPLKEIMKIQLQLKQLKK